MIYWSQSLENGSRSGRWPTCTRRHWQSPSPPLQPAFGTLKICAKPNIFHLNITNVTYVILKTCCASFPSSFSSFKAWTNMKNFTQEDVGKTAVAHSLQQFKVAPSFPPLSSPAQWRIWAPPPPSKKRATPSNNEHNTESPSTIPQAPFQGYLICWELLLLLHLQWVPHHLQNILFLILQIVHLQNHLRLLQLMCRPIEIPDGQDVGRLRLLLSSSLPLRGILDLGLNSKHWSLSIS